MSESAAKEQHRRQKIHMDWLRDAHTLHDWHISCRQHFRVNANQIQGQEVKTIKTNNTDRRLSTIWFLVHGYAGLCVTPNRGLCVLKLMLRVPANASICTLFLYLWNLSEEIVPGCDG